MPLRLKSRVMVQKDLSLVAYPNVREAILESEVEFGNEAVVMLSDRGNIFELNVIGALMLELIEQEMTPAEIISQVVAIFEIDAGSAKADFEAFVGEMCDRGLLVSRE
jgi:hypothetical protein